MIRIEEEKNQTDAKTVIYKNITIGTPTFGRVTTHFMASQTGMQKPIFTSMGLLFVEKKPVDVARNEIVDLCLTTVPTGFILFRDDDVYTERDALNKLFKRFTPALRSDPMKNGDCIVAGTVWSKAVPPLPMIYKEGSTASFEDWRMGELVECDVVGMGCTLIPIGVFPKMLPFVEEWVCTNELCPVHWDITYNKELTEKLKNQCPHCLGKLIPMYFKTVIDEWKGQSVFFTEDTYFCLMAKEAGIKVFADTGVQTWHVDDNGVQYGYHTELGPAWNDHGVIYYWPNTDSKEVKEQKYEDKKNGPIKLNLGCGLADLEHFKNEGYLNVDLYTPNCDIKCDIRELSPIVYDKGQVDEIRASHVLEHLDREHVRFTVRGWLKALKPGGVLNIEVPDFHWAMDNFRKCEEEDHPDMHHFQEAIIFGLQNHPGEYHKCGFTIKKFEKIACDCANMIESYEIKVMTPEEAKRNQGVIFFKAIKKKALQESDANGNINS